MLYISLKQYFFHRIKAVVLIFLVSTPIFGVGDGTSLIVGPGIFAGFIAFPLAMILARRQIRTALGISSHLKIFSYIGLYTLLNSVFLAFYVIISNMRLPAGVTVNDFFLPYLMLLLLNPAIHFFYFARQNGLPFAAACHFSLIRVMIHVGICFGFLLVAGVLFWVIFRWLGVASFF